MLALSYILFFGVIPLLTERDDAELQWHAKHGLVWFALEVIGSIVFGVVVFVLSFATGGAAGCVLTPLGFLLGLGLLVLHVVAIVKAVKGERLLIPGVSDLANRF
jgi:uncharacterized membrane protein